MAIMRHPYPKRTGRLPFRGRPVGRVPAGRAERTSWEEVVGWYGDHLRTHGNLIADIVHPNALRLLAPRAGGRYLDIACGEGAFDRLLLKRMPDAAVVGFDAAPSLVERARERSPRGATYLIGNAMAFARAFGHAEFDGAVCLLALQNVNRADPVFRDAACVLKSGAPLVVVLNHPCFRAPRQSGWGWDDQRQMQYRRVDRYLSEMEVPILMRPGAAPQLKTFSYHRPLSHYFAALAKQGFVVDALEEWVSPKTSDSGPRARAENIARAEFPLFLALRAVKR